jgi:4-hydroxybutyrate CoA-transferase
VRIGVKYCGGCNPRYDRRALVARLRRSFPEHDIREGLNARAEDFAPDLAAVLNGCARACADHGAFTGSRGKVVIDSAEGYDEIAAALSRLAASPTLDKA